MGLLMVARGEQANKEVDGDAMDGRQVRCRCRMRSGGSGAGDHQPNQHQRTLQPAANCMKRLVQHHDGASTVEKAHESRGPGRPVEAAALNGGGTCRPSKVGQLQRGSIKYRVMSSSG